MKTYIIAEAGVNHNGSFENALKLIDIAIDANVDAVKFQTFKATNVISKIAQKAVYQERNTNVQNETQLEMVQKLELSYDDTRKLKSYCDDKGVTFLSSPFDLESIDFLDSLNLDLFKIPSGEITNAPYLLKIAGKKKKMILSTGMCNLDEIRLALGVLSYGLMDWDKSKTQQVFLEAYDKAAQDNLLNEYVTLLHCTTEYPCPLSDVNLKAMNLLNDVFALPVGYSDHTQGIIVPALSVAAGAVVIEKHFTIDKEMEGPDHKASLDPMELRAMVLAIRESEKIMGVSLKECTEAELKNKDIARKSLVAKISIKEGELFSEDNLMIKRPGNGVSPFSYWDFLGKKASKNYNEDELI
jgi:N-acetylneuraminate synthase